jgi:hypothetical protein
VDVVSSFAMTAALEVCTWRARDPLPLPSLTGFQSVGGLGTTTPVGATGPGSGRDASAAGAVLGVVCGAACAVEASATCGCAGRDGACVPVFEAVFLVFWGVMRFESFSVAEE